MKVGIVGLGYVGLTLGVVAASRGHDVYGIDRSSHIRECLSNGHAHFHEPGLNQRISKLINESFFVSDSFSESQPIDVFVITVGTPLLGDSQIPNFSYLESAIDAIEKVYDGSQLVILRSTIAVGVTRKMIIPLLSKMASITPDEVLVSFCPERTVEGIAVKELQELPQIVGGNNDQSITLSESFFRTITPTIINTASLEAAELVKLFNNTYRDVHFAIGNVFNEISQSFGLDGVELIKAANLGYSRSNIPSPGFVGGPCLEKDPYILTHNMPNSEGKKFVLNARKYNESLENKVVNWIKSLQRPSIDSQIAISGLAFKGVPSTSDLRGSNAIKICRQLKDLGYDLNLHDFCANRSEVEELELGSFSSDIFDTVQSASILVILNNHPGYSLLDIDKILSLMSDSPIILDAWGVIDFYKAPTLPNVEHAKIVTLGTIDIQ